MQANFLPKTEIGVLFAILVTIIALGLAFGVMNNSKLSDIKDALVSDPDEVQYVNVFSGQDTTDSTSVNTSGKSYSTLDGDGNFYSRISLNGKQVGSFVATEATHNMYLAFSHDNVNWYWCNGADRGYNADADKTVNNYMSTAEPAGYKYVTVALRGDVGTVNVDLVLEPGASGL